MMTADFNRVYRENSVGCRSANVDKTIVDYACIVATDGDASHDSIADGRRSVNLDRTIVDGSHTVAANHNATTRAITISGNYAHVQQAVI